MNRQFVIKREEFMKIPLLIFGFLLAGFFFGALLEVDLKREALDLNFIDIFFNNASIGIMLVLLTSFISYPIILYNSFFLGLNIYFGIELFGVYKTFMTLIFHTPIEIVGWIICIIASKRMKDFYKTVLKKEINKENIKAVCMLLLTMIAVYFVADIVEYYAFEFLGGHKWLN